MSDFKRRLNRYLVTRRKRRAKRLANKKPRKPLTKGQYRLVVVLLSLVAVGVISVATVSIYMLSYSISKVNGDVIVDLDDYKANQDQTSIIYAYDGNQNLVELLRLHGVENRIWVDYSEMPEDLVNAFVALEDKRFNDHKGVDWYRTVAVVVKYHFKQGGSTITQQLIKNLTGENGRTFNRKFYEIISALNLEKHYNKSTIMEAYLNTLYLDQGCYGVKTAAEKYFGKDVSQLNAAECACIAAITQEPYTYDPLIHPEENRERQLLCLSCMYDQGYFDSKEEYEAAKDYQLIFTNSENYVPQSSGEQNESGSGELSEAEIVKEYSADVPSYYVEYVIDSVIKDLAAAQNITESDAWRKVFYGGLKIYTAVDLDIQETLENVYVNRKTFPNEADTEEKPAVQSAMTIMDYSGRVVAICGGAGTKTSFRCLNRATSSPRPPGSSIKPLSIYAPAFEENLITWSTKIQNYGIILGGKRWPINYGGDPGSESSYVTVQYALAQSYNTVPAQLCKMLTPQVSFNYLVKNFHISTLVSEGDKSDIDYSPMAVGGMNTGVTSLEMTAAFAAFGNNGTYYEPWCYTKVTNSSGSEVLLSNASKTSSKAMSEETAVVMRELMKTVTSSGTAAGYKIGNFEFFAKTGTTTDTKDRWFVGGTPYYVAAVWYGYDQPRAITNVSGNPAGKIFLEVMKTVHAGLEKKTFTGSDNVVMRKYCQSSGLLATDSCASVGYGYYAMSHLPATCTECGSVIYESIPTATYAVENGTGKTTVNVPSTSEKITEGTTAPVHTEEPSTEEVVATTAAGEAD